MIMQLLWVQVEFTQTTFVAVMGNISQQPADCCGFASGTAEFSPTTMNVFEYSLNTKWNK